MRARNLKPGFFKNEYLSELPPMTRLTFAGLSLLADREGRLEDRPSRIKAELFAYEKFDVEAALASLASAPEPFILRYSVNGRKYIEIKNFLKHQHPHIKEPASTIPAPGLSDAVTGPSPGEPHNDRAEPPFPITEPPLSESRERGVAPAHPGIEEIRTYWKEANLLGDPEAFLDHFKSNGWKIGGKAPMKDWEASARNWSRREAEKILQPKRGGRALAHREQYEELSRRSKEGTNA